MDMYSVNQAVSFGNQVGAIVGSENEFRTAQNGMLINHATNKLISDKEGEREDIGVKGSTDAVSLAELPGSISTVKRLSTEEGLAQKSISNIKGAGSSLVDSLTTARTGVTQGIRQGSAPLFSTGPGAGRPLTAVRGVSAPEDVKIASSTADDVTEGMAKGLTKDAPAFESVPDAGSLTKFGLNRVLGVTGDLGLEVGAKSVGALGGAISAEGDIANLITTGRVFKKNESFLSEAGNIGGMGGAALDMASIAVPILAPLAILTNVASAVAQTVGEVKDDSSGVSADTLKQTADKAGSNSLSISPAWSSVGMVASVHGRPNIA